VDRRGGDRAVVSPLHREMERLMQIERRAPRTVLVVDDDADMRKVLKDFLRPVGYDVIEAASGEDAVVLLESEAIDIAVLDKEMPGMNGLDLLSFLKHRCPWLPVIFVTAFGGPQVAEESRRRGALLYVEKPFSLRTIVESIQHIAERAR
jgi:CheY-like chemotaxis protein